VQVPFLDLITPHRELEAELTAVFHQVITTAGFVGGPMVSNFEKAFADYCHTADSIAVNSGTDALRFALMAAGIGPGMVVVTVPNTFIATVEAISQAGAQVEFVDVDEQTSNMSPTALAAYFANDCELNAAGKLISRRFHLPVAAIVPVHLYGQMADMDPICELANRYNLKLIEDACQAHGADYISAIRKQTLRAGSVGHAAAFSFYPGKNLGACGEAGAITTNDPEIAARSRTLRDHGQSKKYYHQIEGYNGRMDSLQAGILSVKLPHLDNWNSARRAHAAAYRELLATQPGLILPTEAANARGIYHLFVVRVANREALIAALAERGIGTGIHYPVPLHQQKAYAHLGYKTGDFPVTEKLAPQILSLPMFPQLTKDQLMLVANTLAELLPHPVAC